MNLRHAILSFGVVFGLAVCASAQPNSLEAWAKGRVEKSLLEPLARKEAQRSRFSRAMPPPAERRVRALSSTFTRDAKDRGFIPYAVDARYGDEWSETYTGCVYEKTGKLFVAVGEEYRPVDYLFGKNADAVPGVCQSAPAS